MRCTALEEMLLYEELEPRDIPVLKRLPRLRTLQIAAPLADVSLLSLLPLKTQLQSVELMPSGSRFSLVRLPLLPITRLAITSEFSAGGSQEALPQLALLEHMIMPPEMLALPLDLRHLSRLCSLRINAPPDLSPAEPPSLKPPPSLTLLQPIHFLHGCDPTAQRNFLAMLPNLSNMSSAFWTALSPCHRTSVQKLTVRPGDSIAEIGLLSSLRRLRIRQGASAAFAAEVFQLLARSPHLQRSLRQLSLPGGLLTSLPPLPNLRRVKILPGDLPAPIPPVALVLPSVVELDIHAENHTYIAALAPCLPNVRRVRLAFGFAATQSIWPALAAFPRLACLTLPIFPTSFLEPLQPLPAVRHLRLPGPILLATEHLCAALPALCELWPNDRMDPAIERTFRERKQPRCLIRRQVAYDRDCQCQN